MVSGAGEGAESRRPHGEGETGMTPSPDRRTHEVVSQAQRAANAIMALALLADHFAECLGPDDFLSPWLREAASDWRTDAASWVSDDGAAQSLPLRLRLVREDAE
jgi:hypothetical protein